MFTITSYTVEGIKDPFGILSGDRFEFMIEIDVEEDDELYTDNGLVVRVVYKAEEERTAVVKHDILERTTGRLVDFELEDDELAVIEAFCREHYAEGDDTDPD
ncbi:DUF6509 family protein [Paenibacillus hodogayensis]|uniref:DUF6509 family protein n=1 Tax=Paenibacillus hodogayensis TaxID=279208 RepID=A0ABV5W211_9BACL